MDSSPIVHTLPYPTIEDGSISFPDGKYSINAERKAVNKVDLVHEITGAPFLSKLIDNGDAKFGCLVSVPKTGYRKLDTCDSNKQKIEWELGITGEAPKLKPVLIYTNDDKEFKLSKDDGVADIWQGKKIVIPKGARLARGELSHRAIRTAQSHKI